MTLLLGMQAARADLSLGDSNVPRDIIGKVMVGLECLASDEFWGIPNGVKAISKVLLASAGNDQEALNAGFKDLSTASAVGEKAGVRMVQALEISIYAMLGRDDQAKELIRKHVASKNKIPANSSFRLLDEVATRNVTLVSDKLWTQATGQRTPYGKLGTFWDDQLDLDSAMDIDDLL